MDTNTLSAYVDKVFAWALNRTGDRMQAEDLAQQILLEAVKSLSSLHQEQAFHAWLWGLANNVYKRWLHKSQQDRYFNVSLAEVDMLLDHSDILDRLLFAEEKAQINRSVAMLSKQWRDILVMYYYEGLSVADIAEVLGLAAGTVKWRLSEARQRVLGQVQKTDEAIAGTDATVKLRLGMDGIGVYPWKKPWPYSYANSAAAQNIAVAAYDEPLTIEEISNRINIPAYYVEDDVQVLIKHELMRQVGNRYQTDFFILRYATYKTIQDTLGQVGAALAEPLVHEVLAAKKTILDIGFGAFGKTFGEQLWVLLPFLFREVSDALTVSPNKWLSYPQRRDGGRWLVHGYEERDILGCRITNSTYTIRGDKVSLVVLTARNIDSQITSHDPLPFSNVEALYQLAQGELNASNLTSEMKEQLSQLLEKGLVSRAGGTFLPCILHFSRSHYNELRRVLGSILTHYSAPLEDLRHQLHSTISRAVPKHLHGQVEFYTKAMSSNVVGYIMRAALHQGLLPPPTEPASAGVFFVERDA